MNIAGTAPCPCGLGGMLRDCCYGKVDWGRILARGNRHEISARLSVRGKNIAFTNEIARILKLDTVSTVDWLTVKRAMTSSAVREIYETLLWLWPDSSDLERSLHSQRNENSALFVGTYMPDVVNRGLARHSLYSDVILVVDPFRHPLSLSDQINPVINPEEHRANTLVALRLWFVLLPWIEAGIVRVIHTPDEFNRDLAWAALEAARKRKESTPELLPILNAQTEAYMASYMDEYREFNDLAVPDAEILRRWRHAYPKATVAETEAMLANLQFRRDEHPFFVKPLPESGGAGEYLSFSSGAAYDIAKIVASRTRAHIVTDQTYRWKEIEIDRAAAGVDEGRWSAFAKALQNAPLRFIDSADLALAQRLRSEQRLEDLRLFFRRVWNTVSADDSFSESVGVDLAAELDQRVKDAEDGWRTINRDLFTWFSTEAVAAGTAVATGHISVLPAALAFVGAATANVVSWASKRSAYAARYPAAVFVRLSNRGAG